MAEVAAYHVDVPDELIGRAIAEGLVAECSKHGLEVAAGHEPDDLEAWIDEQVDEPETREFDPGPEVDDEGGTSEHRFVEPADPS